MMIITRYHMLCVCARSEVCEALVTHPHWLVQLLCWDWNSLLRTLRTE
jgi:hypothetical protein